jgi:hypothetical protein
VLQACNLHSKKLRLEPEEVETEKTTGIQNALFQSALSLDTIIPDPGVKYKESRKINPQEPPVVLDFTSLSATKEFDAADYFSTVKYVKLKYPYPEKGNFLMDATIFVAFERGGYLINEFNSSVFFSAENIIAGDIYMGFHCYDLSGNYQYTVVSPEELSFYDKKKNEINIQYNSKTEMMRSFSILDNNCLILMMKGNNTELYFHHLPSRNNYFKRPVYNRARRFDLLSPESFIDFTYSPTDTTHSPFMSVFDIKGDTLCRFMNYNPKPALKNSAYNNPDHSDHYYYDGVFTIRQAYNDTIYRLKSASELQPAYIMNFGKQKLDIQTALYGDKAGKLIPYKWLEAKDFIIFVYTENYDCPNCRKNETVKFFYSCYDKKNRQLYQIPEKSYPEDYWIKNSLEKGIPFTTERLQIHHELAYACYSKVQMEGMMKNKQFSSIPVAQQEQIRTLSDGMSEDELLLMILE